MNSRFRIQPVIAGLIAWCVVAATARAGLTHRYSFSDAAGSKTAKDSVGKVDATLKGPAATVEAGKLVLKNDPVSSNVAQVSYLEFDAPILPASGSVTMVAWFTAKDVGQYARLINFGMSEGGDGRAFFYFSPRTAEDMSRAAITATDVSGRIPLDNPRLDDDKPRMVAIVIDGKAGKMRVFIDGAEPKSGEDLNENTLDKLKQNDRFLGRSSFDVDPGLAGSIDEFRVYDHALTPQEISAAHKAGPDTVPPAPPATQPGAR